MSEIAKALVAAQLQMSRAIKDSNNPHFRSKYADLGNVMDACLPALNANGIAVYQPTIDVDGERFVETVLIHTSGDELRCRVPLIVSKNDMQGYGSAVTYARRYGLMTMAGVAPEDDDGNAAAKSPPERKQRQPQPKPAAPSMDEINAAADNLRAAESMEDLQSMWFGLDKPIQAAKPVIAAKDEAKARLENLGHALDDEIPY